MIDTGASLTVLSTKAFERVKRSVGAKWVRTAKMNTAGGVIDAPVYEIASLSIDEWKIRNTQIAVINQDFSGLDGLLGMSFLSEFSFNIDQDEKVLLLGVREQPL